MTVKQRLIQFVEYLGLSGREFCRRIGVGSAYINSIRKSISPDVLKTIAIQYPQLNTLWLMTGEGEMLKPAEAPAPPSADPEGLTARLLALVESQQKTIAEQSATISQQTATINNLSEALKKLSTDARGILAASAVALP